MRAEFPLLWVLQAIMLLSLGTILILFPGSMLDSLWPKQYAKPRPADALYEWSITDLKELPPLDPVHDSSMEGREEIRQWVRSFEQGAPPEVRDWIDWIVGWEDPPTAVTEWAAATQARQRPPAFELWRLSGRFEKVSPRELPIGLMRETGPYVLAAALFTILGLLSPTVRRPLARAFMVAGIVGSAAFFQDWHDGDPESFANTSHVDEVFVFIGGLLALALIVGFFRAKLQRASVLVVMLSLGVWWATAFALLLGVELPWVVQGVGGVELPWAAKAVFAGAGAMIFLNAYYWLDGESEDQPQDDAGIAEGRPPQLWSLWALQFLLLLVVGSACLLAPQSMLNILLENNYENGIYYDLAVVHVRQLGVWILAMSLFTFFAMGPLRDRNWRASAWLFTVIYVLFGVTALLNTTTHLYTFWIYLFALQGIIFVPATVVLLMRENPWFAVEVDKDEMGWTLGDLVVGLFMVLPAWLTKSRPEYRRGIVAAGQVVPSTSAAKVLSTFIDPQKCGKVWARFSNRSHDDDAAMDIRGCALKIRTQDGGVLDLMLCTGSFSPTSSLAGFLYVLPISQAMVFLTLSITIAPALLFALMLSIAEVLPWPALGWLVLIVIELVLLIMHILAPSRVMRTNKIAREGMAAGLRRAPESYASLVYYSQVVYHLVASDEKLYLARFRLVPVVNDGEGFSVLATQNGPCNDDLEHLWLQKRCDGEQRAPDYLRRELESRLASEPVRFCLQVQLHASRPEDASKWYDPSSEWSEVDHPWVALGTVELDQTISDSKGERMRWSVANGPRELGFPKAHSAFDYRSLGAALMRIGAATATVCGDRSRKRHLNTLQGAP